MLQRKYKPTLRDRTDHVLDVLSAWLPVIEHLFKWVVLIWLFQQPFVDKSLATLTLRELVIAVGILLWVLTSRHKPSGGK